MRDDEQKAFRAMVAVIALRLQDEPIETLASLVLLANNGFLVPPHYEAVAREAGLVGPGGTILPAMGDVLIAVFELRRADQGRA